MNWQVGDVCRHGRLLLPQNFQNPQAALVSRVSIPITNKTNVDGSSGTTAAAGVTVKRVTKPRVLNVFSAVVPTGESTPPGMSPFVHSRNAVAVSRFSVQREPEIATLKVSNVEQQIALGRIIDKWILKIDQDIEVFWSLIWPDSRARQQERSSGENHSIVGSEV